MIIEHISFILYYHIISHEYFKGDTAKRRFDKLCQ